MQSTTKSTSSLTEISHTVTDENGFFSFAVNPSSAGTYYYYLKYISAGTPVYTYLESANVGSSSIFSNQTLLIVIAAVVIIIVVVVVVLALMRRKPKK